MVQPTHTKKTPVPLEALQSQRYLWMARAFSMVAVLALIADILLFVAIGSLQPLMRVQPFYLNVQDKDQQVIQIIRPQMEKLDEKQLEESMVRQYVFARYGIGADVAELERRWGPDGLIHWMSAPSVWTEFQNNELTNFIDRAKKEGLTRDVKILVVNRPEMLSTSGHHVWKVEMEISDVTQGSERPAVSKFALEIEVDFVPVSRIAWEQRLKNPLGFTVTRFGRKAM